LHGLPDAHRLSLPGHRDLFRRANPSDGKRTENLAKAGDNGRTRFQHFCGDCGSPLFTSGEGGGSDDWGIRWGSIRQRERLKPMRQIWCRCAIPWINDLKGLPARPMD